MASSTPSSYVRRRAIPSSPGLQPQTDLAILNWRREKSVFLGTNQPAGGCELDLPASHGRARAREVRPHQRAATVARLAARLFDYAIWGLRPRAAALGAQGRGLGPGGHRRTLLGHPLIAPIVITCTWIPIEALLIAALGSTPGKWLFGVYLQFSISDAYARRDTQAQLRRALRRAFRVWWEGMAFGFPLLSPILVAVSLREAHAEPGNRLGFRAGRARDARAARRAQCRDRRVRPRGDALALRCGVAPADGRFDRLGADDDHRRASHRRAAEGRADRGRWADQRALSCRRWRR